MKSIIHVLSFFSKEVNEILRQPRLVLSLILGPFLVLLLFGLSYSGGLPQFKVAVVVPPNSLSSDQVEKLKQSISTNFTLVSVDSDESTAMNRLRSGEVDLVEIMPANIQQNVAAGKQSPVGFKYSEINPFDESWVKYLGAAQVNEMNRMLLEGAIKEAQTQSNALANLPPQTLVSPLAPEYQNLRGESLSFVNFYAPSVLALILQHIAITLGALSIVREKERGILEMFRIAPVSPSSIIAGKYLGYLAFLIVLSVVLVALLFVLGTPFLGNVYTFAGVLLLLLLASLGIGFLISCLSNTDSTAVQLSMLMLLVSIFFSGFFLPLENFVPAMRLLTSIVPLTHGIQAFQDIMLKGANPSFENWVMLAIIALVAFLAVQVIFRRQLRRL
ncbi:MAG: ABC transporter permease [Bacteroidota bacterium]